MWNQFNKSCLLLFLPLSQQIYYTILTLQRRNWCFNFYKFTETKKHSVKMKTYLPWNSTWFLPWINPLCQLHSPAYWQLASHTLDAGGSMHIGTHRPAQPPPWNNQNYNLKRVFVSLRILKDALKDLKRNDLNKRTKKKKRNLKVNRSSEVCGGGESYLREEQGREH